MRRVTLVLGLAVMAAPALAQGTPVFAAPQTDVLMNRLHSDPEAMRLLRDYYRLRESDGGRLTPAHAQELRGRYDQIVQRIRSMPYVPLGSRIPRTTDPGPSPADPYIASWAGGF